MQSIRFGIIGTNTITESFIKGVDRIEGAEITAVYSRTLERGTTFAKQYSIEHIYTDLEEMVQSNEIDAVYIASPNALHAAQAITCMIHKKHVLCEKAFATNVREIDEMIKVAKENNVILMEAIKNLYVPNFRVLEESVLKIGKVRKYFGSFCQYSSRYDAYRAGVVLNAFKPELANGALVDIGVYCIAPMVKLFGAPINLKATGFKLTTGVDGEGSIIFEYPEMTASIQYSKISQSNMPSEIQGEDGTLLIDKISSIEQVSLLDRQGKLKQLGQVNEYHDLYDETEYFVNMIRSKDIKERDIRLNDSRIVIQLMEQARAQIGVHYPMEQ